MRAEQGAKADPRTQTCVKSPWSIGRPFVAIILAGQGPSGRARSVLHFVRCILLFMIPLFQFASSVLKVAVARYHVNVAKFLDRDDNSGEKITEFLGNLI